MLRITEFMRLDCVNDTKEVCGEYLNSVIGYRLELHSPLVKPGKRFKEKKRNESIFAPRDPEINIKKFCRDRRTRINLGSVR